MVLGRRSWRQNDRLGLSYLNQSRPTTSDTYNLFIIDRAGCLRRLRPKPLFSTEVRRALWKKTDLTQLKFEKCLSAEVMHGS